MKTIDFLSSSRLIPILILASLLISCSTSPGLSSTPILLPTPTPEKMDCTILPYPMDVKETMSAFVDEFAHVIGPETAPVTMLLLTDFQCPGCKLLADSINWIQTTRPADIRLIIRYLPDGRYDKSLSAMQAAEAAHQQGKFREMYTFLFESQAEWFGLSPESFPEWILARVSSLGIDVNQFEADYLSEEISTRVQQAIEKSASLEIQPPILYINDVSPYSGMADVANLDQTVRLAALEQKKIHTCPDWRLDPAHQYIVRMETNLGEVAVQLYPEKAPQAVNNFLYLVQQGWYDNSPFHSVEPGFVIQAGDPSGTGYGNPGYYFPTELAPGLSFDRAGLLAMANAGAGTNGSLFFITFAPAPQLNGQFTIFGEVLTGMEILESTNEGDPILSMSMEEH